MRGARADDLTLEDAEGVQDQDDVRPRAESLSPFEMDEYYEDAFCVILDGGMRTCCG